MFFPINKLKCVKDIFVFRTTHSLLHVMVVYSGINKNRFKNSILVIICEKLFRKCSYRLFTLKVL